MNSALFRNQSKENSVSLVEAEVGGEVGLGPGGVKAKVDAKIDAVHANIKIDDNVTMDARLGLSASTGIDVGTAGVSLSFLGFGVSVGSRTGISTPFGEISFNF